MFDQFNIFEILFKDDKELAHSAFLKFLFELDPYFYQELLAIEPLLNPKITLEKRMTKKCRLDIHVESSDQIIVIENKFKCLPSRIQLEEYSEIMNKRYSGKKIVKYLLYFDEGTNFKMPPDWLPLTYAKMEESIRSFINLNIDLQYDKKVFIDHYLNSLSKYTRQYNEIKNGYCLEKYFNGRDKNASFWLNIIFHELASKFNDKYRPWVGSGSTYTPLLNIHPQEWHYDNQEKVEFVIQLNGRKLKYYAHLDKVDDKEFRVTQEINRLNNNNFTTTETGKFKGRIKTTSKTCYIYQEDIVEVIKSQNKSITIETLKEAIYNLMYRVKELEEVQV